MIYLSNIQRFSVHDGPGIRTTVFFKGCNLRCLWCHNPETFTAKPLLQYHSMKCTACGKCAAVCPNHAVTVRTGEIVTDRALCTACGKCCDGCVAGAREINGRGYEVGEILETVLRDRAYYDKTNGGLTLSGGEPLLQPDGCTELLSAVKREGISTAMETALNVSRQTVDKVLPLVDFIMCDIKAMDTDLHKRLTGCGNERILDNIRYLSGQGRKMLIRVPVVPTLNDSEENIRAVAEFVNTLPGRHEIEFLKFHSLARDKYASLGMDYPVSDITPPTEEEIQKIRSEFRK